MKIKYTPGRRIETLKINHCCKPYNKKGPSHSKRTCWSYSSVN
ncbi:MAG: hypothetical protein Q8R66_07710 [Methanobacteriaceae archaeon]|nr:hypothetical protein [Methanobacteriaceae archaeon]